MANIKITITDGVDPNLAKKIRAIGTASSISAQKLKLLTNSLDSIGVKNAKGILDLDKAATRLVKSTNAIAVAQAKVSKSSSAAALDLAKVKKANAAAELSEEKLRTQIQLTNAANMEAERSLNRAIAAEERAKIATDALSRSKDASVVSAERAAQAKLRTEATATRSRIALEKESNAIREGELLQKKSEKADEDTANAKLRKANSVAKLAASLEYLGGAETRAAIAGNKLTKSAADAAAAIKNHDAAANRLKTSSNNLTTSVHRKRKAFVDLGSSIIRQNALLNRLAIAANKAGTSVKRLSTIQINSTKAVFASIGRLARNIRNLSLLAGVAFSGVSIVSAADSYTILENKLKTVSTSQGNLNVLMEKQFEVANRVRVPVDDVTKTYVRLDLALAQLGRSQEDSLRINETISKALIVSGANTSEASAATLQLSQAFNKGKLDGDEFRSVMELMPVAADAIAKELGVTRGELLLLAPEGKITAEIMANAFLKASKQIDEQFSKTVPTIGQSFVVLGNKIQQTFGEFNKTFGITERIAKGIIVLSDNIGVVAKTIGVLSATTVAYFAATSTAALLTTGSVKALTVAIASNPIGFFAAGIAAALSYAYLFGDEIKLTADGMVTLQDVAVVAWRLIVDGINNGISNFRMGWAELKITVSQNIDFMVRKLSEFTEPVKSVGNDIIAVFEGAFNATIGFWAKFPNKMILFFMDVQNSAVDLAQKVVDAWVAAKNYILDSVAELSPGVAELLIDTKFMTREGVNVRDYGLNRVDPQYYDSAKIAAEGTISPLGLFREGVANSISKDRLGSLGSSISGSFSGLKEDFLKSDFVTGWKESINLLKGEVYAVAGARRAAEQKALEDEKKRQEELNKLANERKAAEKSLLESSKKATKASKPKIQDYGFVKDFDIQAQSNDVSCGQCAVASVIKDVGGKSMTDNDVNANYGFQLLQALNENSPIKYKDIDLLSSGSKEIMKNALRQGFPVTLGLNGPEFSPSGRGHVIKVVGFEGENIRYMDPNEGKVRDTTFKNIYDSARNTPYPSSQGGPFMFAPESAGTVPKNGKDGNRMQMEASKRAMNEFKEAQKLADVEEKKKRDRVETLAKLNIELNTELALASKLGVINQAEVIVLTELEKLSKKGIELTQTESEVLIKKSEAIAKAQEYQKDYNSIIDESTDSVTEYERKLKANKDALKNGAISVQQYNKNKHRYNELIAEALEPMKKENDAIKEQLKLARLTSEEKEIAIALKEYENQLTKEGYTDLEDLIKKRKENLLLIREETKLSSMKDDILQNSEGSRRKENSLRATAMGDLNKAGSLTSGDVAADNMAFFDSLGIDATGFKSQLDERESLYNEHMDRLAERKKLQLISEKEYHDAVRKINIERQNEELTGAEAMFGSLAQLQNSGIKELATVGKAAAITQALINTYQSVTGTWAYLTPLVGPVGATVGAAAALAAGMANVAQIRSQNVGFKLGGYTGNGGVSEVAGVVHGQEFVMNAQATQRIGVDNLYRMQEGRSPQGLPEGRGGSSNQQAPANVNVPINVVAVGTKQAALEAMRTQEGKTILLEFMEENRTELSRVFGG